MSDDADTLLRDASASAKKIAGKNWREQKAAPLALLPAPREARASD